MVSISIIIVNVIDEVYRYVLYSLKEEWNFIKKNKEEVVIYERNGSYLEVLETVRLGKYLMNFLGFAASFFSLMQKTRA